MKNNLLKYEVTAFIEGSFYCRDLQKWIHQDPLSENRAELRARDIMKETVEQLRKEGIEITQDEYFEKKEEIKEQLMEGASILEDQIVCCISLN